jgi:hypothetical protein
LIGSAIARASQKLANTESSSEPAAIATSFGSAARKMRPVAVPMESIA